MDLRKMCSGDVNSIELNYNRVKLWTFLAMVTNFEFNDKKLPRIVE
jgi:hypothetical protein